MPRWHLNSYIFLEKLRRVSQTERAREEDMRYEDMRCRAPAEQLYRDDVHSSMSTPADRHLIKSDMKSVYHVNYLCLSVLKLNRPWSGITSPMTATQHHIQLGS